MTLSILSRPRRDFIGITSKYSAGSNTLAYVLQRKDYGTVEGVDVGGFLQIQLIDALGDVTSEFAVNDFLYYESDNGVYADTGVQVTSIAFTTRTVLNTNLPFRANGASGYINNLTQRAAWRAEIIVQDENGVQLLENTQQYFADIRGEVLVDLSGFMTTFLTSEINTEFTVPFAVQTDFTQGFSIQYREIYANQSPIPGFTDDSTIFKGFATQSVRQIGEAVSPNMAPYVPYNSSVRNNILPNPDFLPVVTQWTPAAAGNGTWAFTATDSRQPQLGVGGDVPQDIVGNNVKFTENVLKNDALAIWEFVQGRWEFQTASAGRLSVNAIVQPRGPGTSSQTYRYLLTNSIHGDIVFNGINSDLRIVDRSTPFDQTEGAAGNWAALRLNSSGVNDVDWRRNPQSNAPSFGLISANTDGVAYISGVSSGNSRILYNNASTVGFPRNQEFVLDVRLFNYDHIKNGFLEVWTSADSAFADGGVKADLFDLDGEELIKLTVPRFGYFNTQVKMISKIDAVRVGFKVINISSQRFDEDPGAVDVGLLKFEATAVDPLYLDLRVGDLKAWRQYPFSVSTIASDLVDLNNAFPIAIRKDSNDQIIDFRIESAIGSGNVDKIVQQNINTDLEDIVKRLTVGVGNFSTRIYGPPWETNGWFTNTGGGQDLWNVSNDTLDVTLTSNLRSHDARIVKLFNSSNRYIVQLECILKAPPSIDARLEFRTTTQVNPATTTAATFRFSQLTPIEGNRYKVGAILDFPASMGEARLRFLGQAGEQCTMLDVQDTEITNLITELRDIDLIDSLSEFRDQIYIAWNNSLGGVSYWLFDVNQNVNRTLSTNRKTEFIRVEAPRLREDEFRTLDDLNVTAPTTDVPTDKATLDDIIRNSKREGQQVYFITKNGVRQGGVVRSRRQTYDSVEGVYSVVLDIELPRIFQLR